uniref:Uncharacterized protein n=1 Tax=viral metagenome TaxID=1070528 RepID=A0A6M3KRQ3_9ZZZZ
MTEAMKISVSMYEKEITIVERHSEETGLRNFSAALRQIVNEWVCMKAEKDDPVRRAFVEGIVTGC